MTIPLRDITYPEKTTHNIGSHNSSNAVVLSTKTKCNIIFAHIDDRDFLIQKISELLSKLSEERR